VTPPSSSASASDAEAEQELAARRRGDPYLVYRDHHDRQRVLSLPETWTRVVVGRSLNVDLVLSWDEEISGLHAELQRLGDDWLVVDDGLSRNGSFVNGQRVSGRRRLRDGDRLCFGSTELRFQAPFQMTQETVVARHAARDKRAD
jgi:predicted component of type VI protein secretion system